MDPVGFTQHDHHSCIAQNLSAVEQMCADQGLQFTPVRRRVLEILLHEHRALGAYEILDRLRDEGLGSQPPVAYRALDFLVSNGFAHKIEHLNAFAACAHPGQDHTPMFLICRACQSVAEAVAHLPSDTLGRTARAEGFRIEKAVIEAEGLCPHCQDATA
ncbi:transcriptional repressor [Thalassobius vesicularis]|uniref:Transcriptional repressor n=1 Tax=Thalassobius vesicularis TaxID=1294297 RepID=A0A4S3MBT1_9RHOB|nr:Fur family transcriptional regulator [Thalassobius vesicularis]THD76269.1 transcriptional repressor [Thalassobius vesicularis]